MKNIFKTLILIFVLVAGFSSCSKDETMYYTAAQPIISASATTIELGESIMFTDNSKPADGSSIVSWHWDFGENTNSVSNEQNPTYTYTTTGTFTVTLTVTDSHGQQAVKTYQVVVNTPYADLAHAKFEMSGLKVNMNAPVQFTDKSEPARGATITKWEWNFGESNTSVATTQNPTWTYTTSGGFTVTLKVTDSKGNVSSISHDIVVVDPADVISVSWKKQMLGAIENTVSPAMSPDGATVYMWADQSAANAYDVVLKAFDVATGTEKWAFNVNNEFANLNSGAGVRLVYSSPAVGSNGDIYVCARDLKNSGAARKSFLIAIKADGTKNWHYAFGIDANFNYITPAIDASGQIYISHLTNSPFEIAVLNPANGSKVKAISTVAARSGISLDKNGNVYLCTTGANGIFSYSYAGAQNWQYNTNYVTTGGDITIGADGTVYTVAAGSGAGIISATTPSGTQKWEYQTPDVIQFGGVVLGADGTAYANGGNAVAGTPSAGVYAINTDGTLKWHYATEENVNNCVPLVDNRGYVHFITDKGTYYVITDAGVLYGYKSLGTQSYSSPVMNASGNVCIAAQDGDVSYVYCLDTGATSFANSAWPMKGQNQQRTHLQK